MIRYILAVSLVIQFLSYNLFAQERKVDQHRQYWITYVGNLKLSDNWTVNADFSYRWLSEFSERFQFVARGGITRRLTSRWSVSAGYCYFMHYANTHFSQTTRNERRPWEQAVLQVPIRRFLIQNRFRAEQRYFQAITENKWRFNHRLRYQLSLQAPLRGEKLGKGIPYFNMSEEIMFNLGKEIVYNHFDQNRINLGFGYGLTKDLTAYLGYQYGWQKRNSPDSFYNTHTIKINLIQQMDIKEIL